MKKDIVYIFGNPDLVEDSLPLRLLPQLRERFPQIRFECKDPNEEWDIPQELTVIDTVVGITDITVYDGLAQFLAVPHVTMHDYDALTNLRYLQKLGRLREVRIIGLPPNVDEGKAMEEIAKALY